MQRGEEESGGEEGEGEEEEDEDEEEGEGASSVPADIALLPRQSAPL